MKSIHRKNWGVPNLGDSWDQCLKCRQDVLSLQLSPVLFSECGLHSLLEQWFLTKGAESLYPPGDIWQHWGEGILWAEAKDAAKHSTMYRMPSPKKNQGSIISFAFFGGGVLHPRHMKVSQLGVESELQLPAYTTAHGNARFLTRWTRLGIEPTSSWILVGFVTTEPWWELMGLFDSACL